MTQNQVGYLNYLESKRSNLAEEQEDHRHNLSTESLGFANLKESTRHNKVTEKETYRHNVSTEKESKRHNVASETTNFLNLKENIRHNKTNEKLTLKNNQANIALGYQNAKWNYISNLAKTQETMRSNKVNEALKASQINLDQKKFKKDLLMAEVEIVSQDILNKLNEARKDESDSKSYYYDSQAIKNIMGSLSSLLSKLALASV